MSRFRDRFCSRGALARVCTCFGFLFCSALSGVQAQELPSPQKVAIENPRAVALRNQTVMLATRVRELESLTDQLDQHIARLRARAAQEQKRLYTQYDRLEEVLQALFALDRSPEFGLFLYPQDALSANRGQALMASLTTHYSRLARLLEEDVHRMAALQTDIRRKHQQLHARIEDSASYMHRIEQLSARKRSLSSLSQAEQKALFERNRSLAQETRSLRELIARLDKEPLSLVLSAPRAMRNFPRRGGLTVPVAGRWLRRFGATDGFGQTMRGLLIEAVVGTHVLAPYDGRIVFADQFRDQGKLLIIEHKGGYHSVLSQFSELFVSLGQWVLAGEPIGLTQENAEKLYFEVRHNGKPQDPARWVRERSRRRAILSPEP